MEVSRLISRVEQYAPPAGAAPWDASGVQIAGLREKVSKLAVFLDPIPQFIKEALDWGADFILTHHPLVLEPHFLDRIDSYHRVASMVLGQKSWLYAAHTSLDVQPRGPSGWLARELDLRDVEVLDPTVRTPVLQVEIETDKSETSKLIFLNADPQVLSVETVEQGTRLRCLEQAWLLRLHEQLTCALGRKPTCELDRERMQDDVSGYGLVGNLPAPMDFGEFTAKLTALTHREFCLVYGQAPSRVSRLAYCPGSGASLASKSHDAGAQVFITGEMKYHPALELRHCVVDLGHFGLEEEMIRRFCATLAKDPELSHVECRFFPGQDPQRIVLAGDSDHGRA